MRNIKSFILSFMLIGFLNAYGQMTAPKWEISTESKVKWMHVNEWGVLIASCADAIYGINPINGNKLWQINGLTNVKKEGFRTIANTPLLILEDGALLKIVNGLTGDLLIDSQSEGMGKVKDVRFLRTIESLLVEYNHEKKTGLSLYDLDGNVIWKKFFEEAKPSLGLEAQPSPVVDGAGDIYYGVGKELIKLKGATGDELWRAEGKKGVRDFFLSPDHKYIISIDGSVTDVFRNDNARNTDIQVTTGGSGLGKFTVAAFNTQNGSESWSHDYKSKYGGALTGVEDFVLFHRTSLNKIKYSTGEKSWKSEPKYVGGEVCLDLLELEDGSLVYATAGRFSNFFRVSSSGEKMWKKAPILNGDLLRMEVVNDHLLYITNKGANMINLQSGKEVWSRDKFIGSGGLPVLLTYDHSDHPILWSQSRLIRVLPDQKDWELVKSDAKTVGVPYDLVTTKEGFRVSSAQNVMHINESGDVIYNTYFESPTQSFGNQLLLSMASITTSFVGLGVGLTSVKYKMSGMLSNDEKEVAKGELMSDLFETTMAGSAGLNALARRRFREEIESRDYKLILTERNNIIGLVKVNLQTGKEETFLPTEDRTPEFVLDRVDDRLFFKSAPKRISCFEF